MINIVIPMAGLGSRFVEANYQKPKPFIDVAGIPMIARVLENLSYPNARYILIARKEHMRVEIDLVKKIEKQYNAKFIPIDFMTEGTACTVLSAKEYIDNDEALLIANSDQIVGINIQEFIDDCIKRELDGSILTFVDKSKDPKWSFAKINPDGLVEEVREKVAISDIATVGIYLFAKGSVFVDSAIKMIIRNDRVNNEFYTCPVYNYAIEMSAKIGIYNIPFEKMHGLGTPKDLDDFIQQL